MSIITDRRTVLGTGLGTALAAIAGPAFAAGTDEADLIITNARIHTLDPAQPSAAALAVRNGRFVRVGGDMAGLIGKKTQTIDAKGMTIVPGFIDCHNHAHQRQVTLQEFH